MHVFTGHLTENSVNFVQIYVIMGSRGLSTSLTLNIFLEFKYRAQKGYLPITLKNNGLLTNRKFKTQFEFIWRKPVV